MKKSKIILFLFYFFAILIVLGIVFFDKLFFDNSQLIQIEKILVEKKDISLNYGDNMFINVETYPSNANDDNLLWSSSDNSFVSVDQKGNLKVLKNENGFVTITVKTSDGKISETINVIVRKKDSLVKVTGIQTDVNEIQLIYGSSYKINASVIPSNASNKQIIWSSSNENLVTVNSAGIIKGLKNESGTVTITARTKDGGFKKTIKVNVKEILEIIDVTGITVSNSIVNLKYNEQLKINASVIPENATNKQIVWSSSNENLVTVDDNGIVKAKDGTIGSAIVTATTKDGNYSKEIAINIYPSGNYISFKGDSNYSSYKTNILLSREKSVMQSFAIHNGYLYISQQQTDATKGPSISRIELNKISNDYNAIKSFKNNFAILKDYGHTGVIDIEVTDNKPYLWTSCSVDGTSIKYHCRVDLNSIKFDKTIQEPNVSVKGAGIGFFAVDSDNRTIVVMTGSTTKHIFTVYNLDDYIKNSDKATVINSFTIKNTNPVVNGKTSIISRQGIDVSGNYIYSYEGNLTSLEERKHIVYLSVFSLDGKTLVHRKEISYPNDKYYWEPEGIKIYNGEIYIGFGNIDKTTGKKMANIYKLT